MQTATLIIRLLTAVLISLAASGFVYVYSEVSRAHHLSQHPDWPLGYAVVFLTNYRGMAMTVPLTGAVLGFIAVRQKKPLLAEIAISGIYLLSVFVVFLYWFFWEVQNLPGRGY